MKEDRERESIYIKRKCVYYKKRRESERLCERQKCVCMRDREERQGRYMCVEVIARFVDLLVSS